MDFESVLKKNSIIYQFSFFFKFLPFLPAKIFLQKLFSVIKLFKKKNQVQKLSSSLNEKKEKRRNFSALKKLKTKTCFYFLKFFFFILTKNFFRSKNFCPRDQKFAVKDKKKTKINQKLIFFFASCIKCLNFQIAIKIFDKIFEIFRKIFSKIFFVIQKQNEKA